MNNSFARIITLLRKERGYSQKQVAAELGVSQALLSHYEKGIRECGLDFVVKIADYYKVSCDYLLGRTPQRNGATISVEDIPEPDAAGKENVIHGGSGSVLPLLSKKLLANSLNIIYSLLPQFRSKQLITEISIYLNLSAYRVFRLLYSANQKNPQGLFSVPKQLCNGRAEAAQAIAFSNLSVCFPAKRPRNLNIRWKKALRLRFPRSESLPRTRCLPRRSSISSKALKTGWVRKSSRSNYSTAVVIWKHGRPASEYLPKYRAAFAFFIDRAHNHKESVRRNMQRTDSSYCPDFNMPTDSFRANRKPAG